MSAFRGGPVTRKTSLVLAALAAPAATTGLAVLLAMSFGVVRDYDAPKVLGYIFCSTLTASCGATWLYGLPVFLLLARFGLAGWGSLVLAGAAPSLAFFLTLLAGPAGFPNAALGGALTALCGAFTAAVFAFAARKADR